MDKACAYGLANTNYSVVATIDPARVAQSAERKTLNLVVEGSSPSVGVLFRKRYLSNYFVND